MEGAFSKIEHAPSRWATCHKSSQFCRIVHESDAAHASFVLYEGVAMQALLSLALVLKLYFNEKGKSKGEARVTATQVAA